MAFREKVGNLSMTKLRSLLPIHTKEKCVAKITTEIKTTEFKIFQTFYFAGTAMKLLLLMDFSSSVESYENAYLCIRFRSQI